MVDEHLTHGWEPDLDDGDSLLRRFLLANVARNDYLASVAGGRKLRTDALALADPASPVLFDNAGILLQPPGYIAVDDAVEEMLAWYPPDRHFVFMSLWPTPDLRPMGLTLMGHPPLMFRPAGGNAPARPDGLRIDEVRDAGTLRDFVSTLIEAYPMPGASGTALASPALLGGPVRFFVGYLGDRPVATAGAFVGHGMNEVEWVATRAEARRKGIGAALTWAATLVDPSLPATLIASDDGQPVYEAMGYVRLMRITMWHRPVP